LPRCQRHCGILFLARFTQKKRAFVLYGVNRPGFPPLHARRTIADSGVDEGETLTFARSVIALLLGCVVVWPALASKQQAGSKSVSFSILEDYDKGADLREIEADFRLFQALEIDTWRGSFGWDDYEPARGHFDFQWLQRFVETAARYQIRLRPYVAYTPDWAARTAWGDQEAWNNSPRREQDWEQFAGELAGALRRYTNVISYELYNEENVKQWWEGTAREYATLLVRGARAIRRQDQNAAVLFGGLVFPDAEWIEQVCGVAGVGDSFSVLPVHAYPETWTPPDVTVENYLGGLAKFVAAADDRCGPKRIWINETGFATTAGRSEQQQAYWWIRAIATFLAEPRVEHIGVYEIKDLPKDRPAIGDTPNYHLGLTRADRTPKLAFYTVDLLTDLLDVGTITVDDDTVRPVTTDDVTDSLHVHLFGRPDGRRVLFLWDGSGDRRVELRIKNANGVLEYAVDGRPHASQEAAAAVLSDVRLTRGVPRIFVVF
jgi:hypothetical protein